MRTSAVGVTLVKTAASYKELQAKLKDLRDKGYDLHIKLNSKLEVLQAEFERLTSILEAEAQEVLTPTVESLKDETLNNDVQVYTEVTAPAMKTTLAPTWLSKKHKVYVVDGVDYLPYELDQWLKQHEGEACDVTFPLQTPAPQASIADDDVLIEDELTRDKVIVLASTSEVLLVPQVSITVVPVSLSEVKPSTLDSSRGGTVAMMLTFIVRCLLVAWHGVDVRVSTFPHDTDETCLRSYYNVKSLATCTWWFSVGFVEGLSAHHSHSYCSPAK